jgi:hypothetical protein
MRVGRTPPVLFIAAALVAALATPAAGKGKPVPPEEALFDVTMTLVGSEGLSTECDDGDGVAGAVVMTRESGGFVGGESFGIYIDGVSWERRFPPSSGQSLAGCHGGNVDGTNAEYGGFSMNVDDAGAVTDIRWFFDYYVEQAPTGKGRRMKTMIFEHFALSGQDLDWDPTTSTVSGQFNLMHHYWNRYTGEEVDYEPFPGSPRWMEFTVIWVPHQ